MPADKGGAGTRHYVFTLEKDLPLTFFAAFGSIYGNYRLSHMSVTDREDLPAREDLLPWDRAVMGRYNKTVGDVSDWFAVLGAMPLALGAASWYRGDACGRDLAVYSLMFAQALALQSALNLTFRSMKFWPRPYIRLQAQGRQQAFHRAFRRIQPLPPKLLRLRLFKARSRRA